MPFSKWLLTMDRNRPLSKVLVLNGSQKPTTYQVGAHPPSRADSTFFGNFVGVPNQNPRLLRSFGGVFLEVRIPLDGTRKKSSQKPLDPKARHLWVHLSTHSLKGDHPRRFTCRTPPLKVGGCPVVPIETY